MLIKILFLIRQFSKTKVVIQSNKVEKTILGDNKNKY